jgi:hypothetical protein
MGANATQAGGVVTFLVAMTLIAAGLAGEFAAVFLLLGLAVLAVSIALFLKCKSWEHAEE